MLCCMHMFSYSIEAFLQSHKKISGSVVFVFDTPQIPMHSNCFGMKIVLSLVQATNSVFIIVKRFSEVK